MRDELVNREMSIQLSHLSVNVEVLAQSFDRDFVMFQVQGYISL